MKSKEIFISVMPPWRQFYWQVKVASWLMSLAFHSLLLIAIGLMSWGRMRGSAAPCGELAASFTTVIGNGDYFDDEAGQALTLAGGGGADDRLGDRSQSSASPASIVGDESPVDISGALPSRDQSSGLGPGAIFVGGFGRGDYGNGTGAGQFTKGGTLAFRRYALLGPRRRRRTATDCRS